MHLVARQIRLRRLIIDGATQGSRAEQGSLWTPQNRDVVHIEGVDVRDRDGVVWIGERYIVDEITCRTLPLVYARGGGHATDGNARVSGNGGVENDTGCACQVIGHA